MCVGLFAAVVACGGFLDVIPDKKMHVPSTLDDMQSLLDNYLDVNWCDPYAAEASSDNYYLSEQDWQGLPEDQRRMYTWEKDYIFPNFPNAWGTAYEIVFVANTVIQASKRINYTESEKARFDHILGQAYFHRGKAFSQIAFVWAPAYDESTSQTDMGIPLRLNDDFNEISQRSSVEETYRQIISDLARSSVLLKEQETSNYRPTKIAAYATLARVYLSMRKYGEALAYADSAYSFRPTLMDYNTVDYAAARPFSFLNEEIIFYSHAGNLPMLSNNRAKVDSVLVGSFADGDMRKKAFFNPNADGSFGFKGTYTGITAGFTGIATDEIYLIMAECLARLGDVERSILLLNELIETRWEAGRYTPYVTDDASEALDIVLAERRKQLIYRGLRWMDIKRLNKEGFGIELARQLGNNRYVLPPNDLRYALSIPEEVIQRSGIAQNP